MRGVPSLPLVRSWIFCGLLTSSICFTIVPETLIRASQMSRLKHLQLKTRQIKCNHPVLSSPDLNFTMSEGGEGGEG